MGTNSTAGHTHRIAKIRPEICHQAPARGKQFLKSLYFDINNSYFYTFRLSGTVHLVRTAGTVPRPRQTEVHCTHLSIFQIRVVNLASKSAATLPIAVCVPIGIALLVELGPRIDRVISWTGIRIVHHAA